MAACPFGAELVDALFAVEEEDEEEPTPRKPFHEKDMPDKA